MVLSTHRVGTAFCAPIDKGQKEKLGETSDVVFSK